VVSARGILQYLHARLVQQRHRHGPPTRFRLFEYSWAVVNVPCYILDPGTCTLEQFETVINGMAIVKNFIVIGNVEDKAFENESKDGKQQDISIEGRPEL
jgi:hypothetical protein